MSQLAVRETGNSPASLVEAVYVNPVAVFYKHHLGCWNRGVGGIQNSAGDAADGLCKQWCGKKQDHSQAKHE